MSNLEALLLGVVQGLTEFLPISSSGHLILVPWLQNYTFLTYNESFNKTFDVALHAGTLIAAVAFFRLEVWRLLISFFGVLRRRSITTSDERLAIAIALGTVPAVIAGFDAITRVASGLYDIGVGDIATLIEFASKNPDTAPRAVQVQIRSRPAASAAG